LFRGLVADSFGRNFPASKSGLLRQKSLPSATLAHAKAPRQDRIDEIVSEESISGTSEDNELVNNGMKGSASGMFANDDFLRDTLTSWQSPPSPGNNSLAFLIFFHLCFDLILYHY
jgi:hypothetical protein